MAYSPAHVYTNSQCPLFGMSACCSLDEPGKPSFVEHPSRLPPRQIDRASSGARRPPRLTTMQACTSHAGHRGPCSPHIAPATAGACRRTAHRGPEGCSPGRRARLPHQRACTGGSRLWFPIIRLAFQKLSSSCGNFGGRNWVRTSDPSLVRRNRAGILPAKKGWFMNLNCRNHAVRCPGVPGEVCTVVPVSGSRSSAIICSRMASAEAAASPLRLSIRCGATAVSLEEAPPGH